MIHQIMKYHTLTSDSDPDFSIIWLHFVSCKDKQWWFDTKMVERNLSFVSLDLEWHVMSPKSEYYSWKWNSNLPPDKITWWKLKVFDARSLRTACRRCTREQILFSQKQKLIDWYCFALWHCLSYSSLRSCMSSNSYWSWRKIANLSCYTLPNQ